MAGVEAGTGGGTSGTRKKGRVGLRAFRLRTSLTSPGEGRADFVTTFARYEAGDGYGSHPKFETRVTRSGVEVGLWSFAYEGGAAGASRFAVRMHTRLVSRYCGD